VAVQGASSSPARLPCEEVAKELKSVNLSISNAQFGMLERSCRRHYALVLQKATDEDLRLMRSYVPSPGGWHRKAFYLSVETLVRLEALRVVKRGDKGSPTQLQVLLTDAVQAHWAFWWDARITYTGTKRLDDLGWMLESEPNGGRHINNVGMLRRGVVLVHTHKPMVSEAKRKRADAVAESFPTTMQGVRVYADAVARKEQAAWYRMRQQLPVLEVEMQSFKLPEGDAASEMQKYFYEIVARLAPRGVVTLQTTVDAMDKAKDNVLVGLEVNATKYDEWLEAMQHLLHNHTAVVQARRWIHALGWAAVDAIGITVPPTSRSLCPVHTVRPLRFKKLTDIEQVEDLRVIMARSFPRA
jgi:hypothetical protein